MIIGTAALTELQGRGLLALGDGLGKPPATEYAALLRRGVRWFAKGERERHADDRKLAYVTAVDLFFSHPGKGATRRFCEGFAFAMHTQPADVATVARSKCGVYASRSETSHEGAFDVESHDDIDKLRWEVLAFLARMATHTFETKNDVEAWVAERRAALTDAERVVLAEATDRKVLERDMALMRSIGLIGGDIWKVPFDNAMRERVVLQRLLIDAMRDRKSLLELRPLAYDLEAALAAAHSRSDDPVPVVVRALADLLWFVDTLRTRLASDFT
jgi:hypothetical protein